MSRIRAKNTQPEMKVRKLLRAMGYRYRLHLAALPGSPDIVFVGRRKALFVHGCFWHRHADPACRLSRLPKSRLDFWAPKLEKNVIRDAAVRAELSQLGWGVLVIWECELRDCANLELRLRTFLDHAVD
jgi:DNA mismatch endonuclease (patch repair protein)